MRETRFRACTRSAGVDDSWDRSPIRIGRSADDLLVEPFPLRMEQTRLRFSVVNYVAESRDIGFSRLDLKFSLNHRGITEIRLDRMQADGLRKTKVRAMRQHRDTGNLTVGGSVQVDPLWT